MPAAPPLALPYQLPSGRYRVTEVENQTVCAAVGAAPPHGRRAHPIFYYLATQNGIGISVAELFALCDFDPAGGALMVSTTVQFREPILVEEDYVVSGEIIGLTRKPSRTFGAIDLFEFALRLEQPDGRVVIECTNAWVLPRRQSP